MSSVPIQYPFQAEIANESPGAQIAHRGAFQGILDLSQAIGALKGQIDTVKATTAAATAAAAPSTASESTVIGTNVIGMVNNQAGVTTYATQQSDYGSLVYLSDGSAVAVTLTTGVAIQTPWFAFILNEGAGTATLTPASGTINGTSSVALVTGNGAIVFFDGTNFFAVLTSASGGGSYVPLGGATGSRPGSPTLYSVYFDTTLGLPIWWNGANWVNAGGMIS